MLIPLPKELLKPCYIYQEAWRRKFNVDVLMYILIKDDVRDKDKLESRKLRFAYQMGFADGSFKKLDVAYSVLVMKAAQEYIKTNESICPNPHAVKTYTQ